MQPKTPLPRRCALTVKTAGNGKGNPIVAKLTNIRLASGMRNTTATKRSIVFIFEKLGLVCDKLITESVQAKFYCDAHEH